MILAIARRNLLRQSERFLVLFLTLSLGGWLFVLLLGTTNSLFQTLQDRAARYFSGDVILTSYNNRPVDRWIEDEAALLQAVKDSGVAYESLSRRSINYDQTTTLFFGNFSQGQRRLIGVDWALETPSFRSMDFVLGDAEQMIAGDGILISDATASRLKAQLGDVIHVSFNTLSGQKNVLDLKLRGVFRDPSFFGYSSYVDIRTLNVALGKPEHALSEFGLNLSPGADAIRAAEAVRRALEGRVPLLSFVTTQPELEQVLSREIVDSTRKYAVLPLPVRLAQIQSILDALSLVTWGLNLLFLFIILVGVNNTYRMIVFERIREIGTMRALGMTRGKLVEVFLVEAALLGLAGAATGWLVGNLTLWVVSLFDFGNNVLLAMFLQQGHLVWTVPWPGLFAVCTSLVVATLLGAGAPAVGAASWKPVDALRHDS